MWIFILNFLFKYIIFSFVNDIWVWFIRHLRIHLQTLGCRTGGFLEGLDLIWPRCSLDLRINGSSDPRIVILNPSICNWILNIFFSHVSKIRHVWHWLSYQTSIIFDVEVYAWGHHMIPTMRRPDRRWIHQPQAEPLAWCAERRSSVVIVASLREVARRFQLKIMKNIIEFDIHDWNIPPKLLEINTDTWWYAVAHLKSDVEIEGPRFVFHLWEVFLVNTVSQRGFKFPCAFKDEIVCWFAYEGITKVIVTAVYTTYHAYYIPLAGNLQHLVPQSCNIVFESVTSWQDVIYSIHSVQISSVSPSRACLQNVFIVNMQTGRTFAARETGLKFLQRKVGLKSMMCRYIRVACLDVFGDKKGAIWIPIANFEECTKHGNMH